MFEHQPLNGSKESERTASLLRLSCCMLSTYSSQRNFLDSWDRGRSGRKQKQAWGEYANLHIFSMFIAHAMLTCDTVFNILQSVCFIGIIVLFSSPERWRKPSNYALWLKCECLVSPIHNHVSLLLFLFWIPCPDHCSTQRCPLGGALTLVVHTNMAWAATR